jgi:hypothetical protein
VGITSSAFKGKGTRRRLLAMQLPASPAIRAMQKKWEIFETDNTPQDKRIKALSMEIDNTISLFSHASLLMEQPLRSEVG